MKGDKNNRIFVPKSVADELEKVEDNLNKWRKQSNIPILPITGSVSQCLRTIYATDSSHTQLVDNVKGRPLADPWVIAHAIDPKACVVTKEAKNTAANSSRVRIPNVCGCITDFQLIEELGMQFTCSLKKIISG